VAQFFAGNLAAQVDVLHDVKVGVNARVNVDLNPLGHKLDVEMDLGQASLVIDGPQEALWIKGHTGPGENPLAHSPLDELVLKNNSAVEMFFERGGDYFITAEAGIDFAGADLDVQLLIFQDGIQAVLEGSIRWSASIDYGPGKVSGTAKATIRAVLAIEIDDDGDVQLAGSISADGKLTAKIAGDSTTLFSGSIEAKVRSGGLRFRFPRGVGNLDFDLF